MILFPLFISQALSKAVELVEAGLRGANRAISVSPRDISAYVRLASLIKTNQTRLPEALRLCRAALEKTPEDFRALRETGHVLLNMGRVTEAKVYLQRAIELNPSEPNVNFLLGVVEGELGNVIVAERNIRNAMSLGGEANARTYAGHLGHVLQRKREMEEGKAGPHERI
jgi:predicted Zn-dependent protease